LILVWVKWAGQKPPVERIKMNTPQTTEKNEQKPATSGSARRLIQEINRHTRKRFASEDKIRIVLEGFKQEAPVSELCRREGISSALYYSWLKDFMEAGKERLRKDSLRDATKSEVKKLRVENDKLKRLYGEQALELQLFKKSLKY
jgi:transposase